MVAEFSLQDYQAALSAAAFYRVPGAGYLRLGGADRLAFLQRQTTNDVTRLAPGHTILTVLTNPAARILDVLLLLPETDEVAGMLSLPGLAGETARFLKSRIFFKDQVSLSEASHELAQIDLVGPSAGEALARLGIQQLPGTEKLLSGEIEGVDIRALGTPVYALPGTRLLVPAAQVDRVEAALTRQGAMPLTHASYQILRVENCLPGVESELTREYTPLEVGLEAAISSSKGCYTGQEVIARQHNFDKVTQHLALLRLQAPGQAVERLWVGGKPVGLLTSAATSPRFGPLALAVIKRPYHQPGTSVIIGGDGKTGGAPAQVAALPLTPPD